MSRLVAALKSIFRLFDPFIVVLIGVVVLATLLPCQGAAATGFDLLADIGIFTLFFMHGAKLSREAIVKGFLNLKLHIATLILTFVLFPLLGLAFLQLPGINPILLPGILYLCLLPSTVQSSIAFTSIAKGNVPAAVCAATLSNLLGMFVSPALVAIMMQMPGVSSQVSLGSVQKIAFQLLLPFVLGHMVRPWIGQWVGKNKAILGKLDRVSILLVVYTAFSGAVMKGLWTQVSWQNLVVLALLCIALLSLVFLVSWQLGRWLGLVREDSVVLFFCGSKKSLASGVPMANTLFPASEIGLIILPLMFFHQIQLIACALIAKRWGSKTSGG
jgi:solute carrier family 10 (sodium/bile acid cotransporter), member 7